MLMRSEVDVEAAAALSSSLGMRAKGAPETRQQGNGVERGARRWLAHLLAIALAWSASAPAWASDTDFSVTVSLAAAAVQLIFGLLAGLGLFFFQRTMTAVDARHEEQGKRLDRLEEKLSTTREEYARREETQEVARSARQETARLREETNTRLKSLEDRMTHLDSQVGAANTKLNGIGQELHQVYSLLRGQGAS